MKTVLAISVLMVAAGCVSNTEYDRDQAYSKCESISVESARDRCISDAIRRAERARHEDNERLAQAIFLLLLGSAARCGCISPQSHYDDFSIAECREIPTPYARLECERSARDAIADRRNTS